MKKIVLITGATAGIGRATALKLAQDGYNLIITGRRAERLTQLKEEIESKYDSEILPLCFDIRAYAEVEKALITDIPKKWSKIDILINNAGLGTFSPIHEGILEEWDNMIDTNIKGLLYVTRAITPGMIERKSGHIINLGSNVGKTPILHASVYCATKFAIDGLSKCMRLELSPYGIRLTQICPGQVKSEFALVSHKGNVELAKKDFGDLTPLESEDIANAISYALSQPPHVNVKDIWVMPTEQSLA